MLLILFLAFEVKSEHTLITQILNFALESTLIFPIFLNVVIWIGHFMFFCVENCTVTFTVFSRLLLLSTVAIFATSISISLLWAFLSHDSYLQACPQTHISNASTGMYCTANLSKLTKSIHSRILTNLRVTHFNIFWGTIFDITLCFIVYDRAYIVHLEVAKLVNLQT